MIKKLLLILFGLFITVNCWATDYSQDANCQGYFPMEDDGNETDEGVNASTSDLIEYSGDIPQSADKKFGTYSRDFERGDTEALYHNDGKPTDISGANQSISICAWVKRESDTGDDEVIVAKFDAGSSWCQYALIVRGGIDDVTCFGLSPDGTWTNTVLANGATTISTGSWFHICGVYNDTDMRIYVNGSLDTNGANNPKTYSSGIANDDGYFTIGDDTYNGSPAYYWDGLIDDVVILNRELSSAEVNDIYTNGVKGVVSTRRVMIIQ